MYMCACISICPHTIRTNNKFKSQEEQEQVISYKFPRQPPHRLFHCIPGSFLLARCLAQGHSERERVLLCPTCHNILRTSRMLYALGKIQMCIRHCDSDCPRAWEICLFSKKKPKRLSLMCLERLRLHLEALSR